MNPILHIVWALLSMVGVQTHDRTFPDLPMVCDVYPLPSNEVYAMDDGTTKTHSGIRPEDTMHVMLMQQMLNGFGEDPLVVDGIYGPRTRDAVKSYQTSMTWQGSHVRATGQFDQATWQQAVKYGWNYRLC